MGYLPSSLPCRPPPLCSLSESPPVPSIQSESLVEGLAKMARKGPRCQNARSCVPTRKGSGLGLEDCRAPKSGWEQAGLCCQILAPFCQPPGSILKRRVLVLPPITNRVQLLLRTEGYALCCEEAVGSPDPSFSLSARWRSAGGSPGAGRDAVCKLLPHAGMGTALFSQQPAQFS